MKVVKKHINEKFVEDSDPVTDMGIGIRAQISRWMKERGEEDTDENALAECAKAGKLEWVKFLIAAGADVHYYDDYALRWASCNGHLEIVKELLRAGADVHAFNDKSLRYASAYGHLEVVKELLKAGANVHANQDNSFAQTALESAKKYGHQDVVDFLEDYIAKEKKFKDRTVKESLLEKFFEDSDPVTDMGIGTRAQISNWLKSIGILSKSDNRALVECARHGKLDWVKFLIATGANVNAFDNWALQCACLSGYLQIVKELLKAGANPGAQNFLALQYARKKNHTEIIKVLEEHIDNETNNTVKESIGVGAGYSLSRFSGSNGGSGGGGNLGKSNTMYTYEILPLNHSLEPPPTAELSSTEEVRIGTKISGNPIRSNAYPDGKKRITGIVQKIVTSESNSIEYYLVLDESNQKLVKVDPIGVRIDTHEPFRFPQNGEINNLSSRRKEKLKKHLKEHSFKSYDDWMLDE
jgi:ankyrin repeat protein